MVQVLQLRSLRLRVSLRNWHIGTVLSLSYSSQPQVSYFSHFLESAEIRGFHTSQSSYSGSQRCLPICSVHILATVVNCGDVIRGDCSYGVIFGHAPDPPSDPLFCRKAAITWWLDLVLLSGLFSVVFLTC